MPQIVFNPISGEFDFIRRPGEGQVVGEVPSGTVNGVNTTFTTSKNFLEDSIAVYLNGQRMTEGSSSDSTVSESGGLGTGFDTIDFTFAPKNVGGYTDQITVDYTEA